MNEAAVLDQPSEAQQKAAQATQQMSEQRGATQAAGSLGDAAESLNRDAVLALVKRTSRSQMIVYPTTNSGYGVGETGKYCTEETPLKPISLYGATKCDAENGVLDAGNGISLRLATVMDLVLKQRSRRRSARSVCTRVPRCT